MEDDNIKVCPVSGKRCYTAQEATRVIHIAHTRRINAGNKHCGKHIPQRIYKCPHCGCWHTTSTKSAKKKKKYSGK